MDIIDYESLAFAIREFEPEAVVHFAEQWFTVLHDRSPARRLHSSPTMLLEMLNLLFALRVASALSAPSGPKLGTMGGRYQTPSIDIVEGDTTI